MSALRVLVVDDEKNIRATLRVCLEAEGCKVTEAATADAALLAVRQAPIDLAFLDLRLGPASGLELLPALLAENPSLAIVIVTAYGTVDTAVDAMKKGARDYLPKPFTPAQIRHVVQRLASQRALEGRLGELEGQLAEAMPPFLVETTSAPMQAAQELIRRAATSSEAAVLLSGESGTGKGVLARMLHSLSGRARGPFATVNCPTLSEQLLTSELFGHARGSFTGAVRDQPGRVEQAEGGTLFLDEIGQLGPALQGQLLRFLQDKEFERLGEARTRRANVRVVAASNSDLEAEVKAGRFREDLLYRLNVVEVRVPALRERVDDIVPMARHFLSFFARTAKRSHVELSNSSEAMLREYPWPGNVRELKNALERAVIVWPGDLIEPAAFPGRISAARKTDLQLGGPFSLEDIEREHVLRVLATATSAEEAARTLGIDASTLWRKRRKWEGT